MDGVRSEGPGIPSPHLGCHVDLLFGVCASLEEYMNGWILLDITSAVQRLPGLTVDTFLTSVRQFTALWEKFPFCS